MKFSRRIEACRPSPIRKFLPYEQTAAAAGRTVYHLNIGQPDIPTPRAFFDAVRAFRGRTLSYAPSPGVDVFVDAVRDYYAKLNAALDRRDILATFGGSEALQILFACVLDEGDEILIPEPYYPNYHTFLTAIGAVIRPIPTDAAEGYHYADYARIKPLIGERTRAILVTNPGNPSGTVLRAEERRFLLDIARDHNLLLISDEIYRDFVYREESDGTLEPAGTMLEYMDSHIAVVDSISKRFSATGARVGTLISRNRELMEHAMKLCQGRLSAAVMEQTGAAALYQTLTPEYMEAVRREYQRRRDTVVEELRRIPGVRFTVPEGGLYVMASLPVDDTERLQYFLLDEFQDSGDTVMIAPGEGFYSTPGLGRNEARIAFVTAEEKLRRALQILRRGIRAYKAKERI